MSSIIIDRRVQQGKSAGNRQRVLRRLSHLLREQVQTILNHRHIKDVAAPVEMELQKKDIAEPTFTFEQNTGTSDRVLPGNNKYQVGDQIPKEEEEATGSGEGGGGTDSFQFMLSREEFLNLLFDGLSLPPLLKKELTDISKNKFKRGGVVRQGNPGNLSVLRTFKASLGRRVAARGSQDEEREHLELLLREASAAQDDTQVKILQAQLEELMMRSRYVPFIDPVDLRHRSLLEVPAPHTAAVLFCLMDVSASMDEELKGLAKRFFTLLYLFLARKYEKVELVFIRHTDVAEEVDEDEFFYGRQTGGTLVLSALTKMHQLIETRYPPSRYNIFAAQASDGDSFGSDPIQSRLFLRKHILPAVRYFVYAETAENPLVRTSLWNAYEGLLADNFKMAAMHTPADVYPALAQLFEKEST